MNSCHPRHLQKFLGQPGSQGFQEVELTILDHPSHYLVEIHVVDSVSHFVTVARPPGFSLNLQIDDENPPGPSFRLRDPVVAEKVQLLQDQTVS
jgi:hypothetical protein